MREADLLHRIEEDSEFMAVQGASPTISRLGETGTAGSLKVVDLEAKRIEAELTRLLAEHPEAELLAARIDEKIDRLADKEWFKEGLDADEGPTMQLSAGTESLDLLHKKGIITQEMYDQHKVNLAAVVWSSLANPRSFSPKKRQEDLESRRLVTGDDEARAIEIIKLISQLSIEVRRAAKRRAEQEVQQAENSS